MGLTVVDAGVVIGLLDDGDVHHHGALRVLLEAWERRDRIAIPSSAYAEALVGPARAGVRGITEMRDFVERVPIEVAPIDMAIAEVAAALRRRVRTTLRLPDALVIATAIHMDADTLVTTDARWPRRTTLGLRGQLITLAPDP